MSSQVEQLLVVQDRDRKMLRLRKEIEELPERKKMIEAQADAHRKTVEAADEVIRQRSLEQKNLEAQIQAHQERIQKFRQQQMTVKNNDDYRTFEEQIKKTQHDITVLEDRELESMESVEAAQAVRAVKSAALREEQTVVDEELKQFEERMANIQKELEALEAARCELVAPIDPDWLSRYERTFQHTRDYALVPVEHNTCGGCHMKLPPQCAYDARQLDSMTACMYCGRLLYYIP